MLIIFIAVGRSSLWAETLVALEIWDYTKKNDWMCKHACVSLFSAFWTLIWCDWCTSGSWGPLVSCYEPWAMSWNKPCSSEVTFVRVFYHGHRKKETKTTALTNLEKNWKLRHWRVIPNSWPLTETELMDSQWRLITYVKDSNFSQIYIWLKYNYINIISYNKCIVLFSSSLLNSDPFQQWLCFCETQEFLLRKFKTARKNNFKDSLKKD